MKTVAELLLVALRSAGKNERDQLQAAISAYADKSPRSLRILMRAPGFRALWTAMVGGSW